VTRPVNGSGAPARESAAPVDPPRFPWHTLPSPAVPAPSTRFTVHGQPAGFITRALAAAVDAGAALLAVAAGYAVVTGLRFLAHPTAFRLVGPSPELLVLVGMLVLAAYWTATWTLSGRSHGGQLLGLRVVGPRGARLHWSHAAARAVLCVIFPLGLLWALVSRHNRSVQDLVLRTTVVYD
jgi:uncharacterized RDD family membrane protein YckC